MRLTSESDYAIRIINFLANENRKVDANEISEKTGVTLRFALKILRKLKLCSIVNSVKGISGGYLLNKLPEDISFLEVIEAIEGPMEINRCIDENFKCTNPKVIDTGKCEVHDFLVLFNDSTIEKLKQKKFKN